MRLAIVALAATASLAACAEVAPLRNDDGTTDYYINCDDSMRLESCHSAMSRVCPRGYDLRPAGPNPQPDPERPDLPPPPPRNDGLFRCR
jgi:hypothetical protein